MTRVVGLLRTINNNYYYDRYLTVTRVGLLRTINNNCYYDRYLTGTRVVGLFDVTCGAVALVRSACVFTQHAVAADAGVLLAFVDVDVALRPPPPVHAQTAGLAVAASRAVPAVARRVAVGSVFQIGAI